MMLRPMPRPGSLENIRSGAVLAASLWRVAIRTCVQDEDWFGADEDGADAALMRIVAQCGCACVLRGWFVCVCACVCVWCLVACLVVLRCSGPNCRRSTFRWWKPHGGDP